MTEKSAVEQKEASMHQEIANQQEKVRSSSKDTRRHTVAAQLAAGFSTILMYPLDSVKFRIMSQDGTKQHTYHQAGRDFKGMIPAVYDTYRNEGLRTLYRGCCLSLFGSVFAWGVYMFLYKYMTAMYSELCEQKRSVLVDYSASLLASTITASVSNPLWLIKTRMQLQDRSAANITYYKNFFHGIREVVRHEGVRALWKGLLPQMMLSIPNAAYLPLYESMKHSILQQRTQGDTRPLTLVEILFCTLTAKSVAAIVSNPLLVIKTKIQDHRNVTASGASDLRYANIRSVVSTVMSCEGFFRGLVFRGLAGSLAQTIPRSTAHILMYEFFLRCV